jgi:hypothetical protein
MFKKTWAVDYFLKSVEKVSFLSAKERSEGYERTYICRSRGNIAGSSDCC